MLARAKIKYGTMLFLRAICDVGITILLVEHNMSLVMDVADHVIVLDAGHVIAADHPARSKTILKLSKPISAGQGQPMLELHRVSVSYGARRSFTTLI